MTSIEFAKMIGVSQSMVSRAMNDSPLVSSEKREYIKKKAMEYGFVLNSQAQSLRTKRTGTVAILIPEHFKGMSISIGLACFYDAIEKELVKYGYDIMVIYDKYRDARWHSVWSRKEGQRDKETIDAIKKEKKNIAGW